MKRGTRSRVRFNTIGFQMTAVIIVCVAVLLFLLTAETLYAIDKAEEAATRARRDSMTLNIGRFDAELDEIRNQLKVTGTTVPQMANMTSLSGSARFFAEQAIFNRLYSLLAIYDHVVTFFVSTPDDGCLLEISDFGRYVAAKRQDAFARYLAQDTLYTDDRYLGGWTAVCVGEEWYLLCTYRYNRVYLGACVSLNLVLDSFRQQSVYEDGLLFLTSNEGEPFSDAREARALELDMKPGQKWYRTGRGGGYTAIAEASESSNINLVYVRAKSSFWQQMDTFQRVILLLIILATLAFVPWMLRMLRKLILRPLRELSVAIARVGSRSFDYRITAQASSAEMGEVFAAFNRMSGQIEFLQNEIWKKGMEEQNLRIAYLQHQMRPHFILNTLNLIYNNTYRDNNELIRTVIERLSSYLRYTLRSEQTIVSLAQEMRFVTDYLEIQRCYYQDLLQYYAALPENCREIPMPSFLLIPLVENCVKHGFSAEGVTHIRVECEMENGCLCIRVRDDGPGFSEKALHTFSAEHLEAEEGAHIGLWNVRRRLELIYRGKAALVLQNSQEGGAEVTVRFPCQVPTP